MNTLVADHDVFAVAISFSGDAPLIATRSRAPLAIHASYKPECRNRGYLSSGMLVGSNGIAGNLAHQNSSPKGSPFRE